MATLKNVAFLMLAAVLLPLMTERALSEPGAEKPFYRAELVFKKTLRYIRCHSSSIIELPDGSLLAAWWNGSEEGGKDVVVRAACKAPGKDFWDPARVIADTPGEQCIRHIPARELEFAGQTLITLCRHAHQLCLLDWLFCFAAAHRCSTCRCRNRRSHPSARN